MANLKNTNELIELFSSGYPVGYTRGLIDFLKGEPLASNTQDDDDDELDDGPDTDGPEKDADEDMVAVLPRALPKAKNQDMIFYATDAALSFWGVAWDDLRQKIKQGVDSSDKKLLVSFLNFVFNSSLVMRPDLAVSLQDDFKKWQRTKSVLPRKAINVIDPLGQMDNDFVNGVTLGDWITYAQSGPEIFLKAMDDLLTRNRDIYKKVLEIVPRTTFEQNVEWFLDSSGILDNQKKSLTGVLRLLGANKLKVTDGLLALEDQNTLTVHSIGKILDNIFDVPETTTAAIFKEETGLLARKGLAQYENGFRDNKPFSTGFGKMALLDFFREYTDAEDFRRHIVSEASQPFDKTLSSDIDEKSFAHIGQDVNNLIVALGQKNPMKILITGAPGSGKTALLQYALTKAGRNGIMCRDEDFEPYTVERIRSFSSMFSNAALIIEQADQLEQKDLTAMIKSKQRNFEVWVLPSSALLDQSVMNSFDMVIDIPSFPLEQREKLAKQLFDDPETQKKVARICSTPGEIKRLYNWSEASGQKTWKELSVVANNVLQASIKSRASAIGKALPIQLFQPSANGEGFEGVVGYENVVEQAKKMISGYKNAAKFRELGAKPPKGVLMSGGPGLGKTHLVRAMAQEAGVPLLVAGSAAMAGDPELISAVFSEARRQSPCILFLDELDALGASGKKIDGSAESPERQGILNRLLTEIDGFDGLSDVLVVGATHRAEVLDDALTRSGRLGWNIQFKMPDKKARQKIWEYYAQDKKMQRDINWERVARLSVNMSPADINEASKNAALTAAFANKNAIAQKDIEQAIDHIQFGAADDKADFVREELHRTAVHEAGHAVVSFLLGRPIERITIKPRQQMYGFVQHVHDETKNYLTEEDAKTKVKILFAGRVAEEVCLQSRSRGASSDLDKIRMIIQELVRDEGMGDILYGTDSVGSSQKTLQTVENDEQKISKECYEQTTHLITTHKNTVEALAETLMAEREIDHEAVVEFFAAQNMSMEGFDTPKVKQRVRPK